MWCIIPAAGKGRRFGSAISKQYHLLGGRTIIDRTIERIASHPLITGIVLVLADYDKTWDNITHKLEKPILKASEGKERFLSVYNGLCILSKVINDDDYVLIHDAVRPFVQHQDLSKLIHSKKLNHDGAALGAIIDDTIKEVSTKKDQCYAHITKTVDRNYIMRAMTPQMFKLGDLIKATETVLKKNITNVTDDANLLEYLCKNTLIIDSYKYNIKITTPEDLHFAEALLKIGI